ncbi:MAG: type II secretion system protein [Candidatus Omnitrophica bacterium]|nr:type II secretion system protein [Candidatus Omnitrophota bacterium]
MNNLITIPQNELTTRSPNGRGFTIMELLIVVALIGLIAAFTLPDYTKSIRKAHERDMLMQLTTIHDANIIYKAQHGKYWPAVTTDIEEINSNLGINLRPIEDTWFYYSSPSDGAFFQVGCTWGGHDGFQIYIDELPISASPPENPYCEWSVGVSDTCPSLPIIIPRWRDPLY